MKPLVIVTEKLAEEPMEWLAMRTDVHRCAADDPGFEQILTQASALVVRTHTLVDDVLLRRAQRLRVVARAGVGLDNVDLAACRSRGIKVVYAPDANTQAVVEFVLAAVLARIRPLLRVDRPLQLDAWQGLRDDSVPQKLLGELTVGILGLGRIGRRVAEVCSAVGCEVLYCDLLEIPEGRRGGGRPETVESLFALSDVVSIHIDGRPSNRKYVDASLLRALRPGAMFVNSSRGLVVDNLALATRLAERPDLTAVLDVHEPEPIVDTCPLLGLPNAVLYPHIAGRSETALVNMSWVVRDVMRVLEGEAPENPAPEFD